MDKFTGKTVLVTGAGGSIGSAICRTLTESKLVLVGHSELPLYDLARELPRSVPVLADIRDLSRMIEVMKEFRPDYVFHAAAIKHLPFAQSHPVEAIKTNIFGSRNVSIACQITGAKMVMVSTDKAVVPNCVMGRTKRIAELYCGIQPNTSVVRLGNVLRSSGSVIPLFEKQIAQGGPVTVTHPDMSRYFISIEDAVNLITQAASLNTHNLYVLKMRKYKIVDIAQDLIGGKDVKIQITGLRTGEKLDEDLFYDDEPADEMGNLYGSHVRTVDSVAINRFITALETEPELLQIYDYA